MKLFFTFAVLGLGLIASSAEPPRGFERNGSVLSINGAGANHADVVLLTHNRRDVVEAARTVLKPGGAVYAAESSRALLEGAEQHWQEWWTKRFDYYGQQVTKIPTRDFPASHYLKEGDVFTWEGIEFRYVDLPGYTRDGGGYITDLPEFGKVIFTSDLILKGGKVPDLYSFQDEIPAAKIGGYHGYLGRIGAWLESIEKLKREKPDWIVPQSGDGISNPAETLTIAARHGRDIYRNYLSTNALHWYFGEERMAAAAELVLGKDHGVKGMPFAEHIDLPDWCQHIGTTKLLISKSKRAFAIDVGGRSQFEALFKYQKSGEVEGYDGIFVTHTHNDHSSFVADAEAEFGCPIYGVKEVTEVLTNPGSWFLPGLPNKPVSRMIAMEDGATLKWEEFTFTFRFFPGQMYNHGALLVEKEGDTPVFFIGDSFSPSGIDDYCVMNRNLLHDDTGYLKCFEIVDKMPAGTWLVNQHINHRFRFNAGEFEFLRSTYLERRKMIADFVSGDDPNYAVDEQWAAVFPYGQAAKPGQTLKADLEIWNHSPVKRDFLITIHGDEYVAPLSQPQILTLDPGQKGGLEIQLHASPDTPDGTRVFTADIESGPEISQKHWIEGLFHFDAQNL